MVELFREFSFSGLLWPAILFWIVAGGLFAWTTRSPIFWTELITSGRRNRQFLIRVIYALALFWILWTTYQSTFYSWQNDYGKVVTHRQMAEFARTFYLWFAWVQLIAVLLVTPAMVGGLIAVEREQKTIEYLFASDLTDSEIVLGKLGSKVAQLAMLLLTALPVLAIATLFGGISGENLVIAFSVALCTAASLSALALTMSIWSKRARDAVVGTYLITLAFLILPGMLQLLNGFSGIPLVDGVYSACTDALVDANPVVLLGNDVRSAWTGRSTWTQLYTFAAMHLAFSVLGVAWSTYSVRRAHRWLAGASEQRKKTWQGLPRLRPGVFDSAMLWKEIFSERWKLGWASMLALSAVVGVTVFWQVWLWAQSNGRGFGPRGELAIMASTMTACGLLLIQAARASMSLTSERERDTWISLMSTPLEASEVVWAKIVGSIVSVRWLELLLPFSWVLGIASDPEFLLAIPLHLLTIAVLTFFVTTLGVYISLWCRTSTRAVCTTVGILIFLGGAYLMCCIPCLMVMSGPGSDRGAALIAAPCMLFLIAGSAVICLEGPPSRQPEIVIALVGGISMYLVAGAILLGMTIERLKKEERRG